MAILLLAKKVNSANHPRSYLLAKHNALQIAGAVEIENDDGQAVVHAQRYGGGVHHSQAFGKHVNITDFGKQLGVRHFRGIGVVNAVHLGGFEDHFGFDLHAAQGGGSIRGEERIPGASGENHHAAFFHVANHSAPDERLGNLTHFDGSDDARGGTGGF